MIDMMYSSKLCKKLLAYDARFEAWKLTQPEAEEIITMPDMIRMYGKPSEKPAVSKLMNAQRTLNLRISAALRKRYAATVEPEIIKR